jgi:hypothetical protein
MAGHDGCVSGSTGSTDDREIEWLDAGRTPPSDDVIHTRRPPNPRRRLWWIGLAALALVAGIVVATRPHHGKPAASSTPSPSPSPSHTTPFRPPGSPEGPGNPSTARGTPTVTNGPALLDVPSSWELFGRASDAVIEMKLAAGEITVTPIPLLSSSGPASFVVGPDRAIVRPLDVIAGYDVRDGQPYENLSTNFPTSGPALPGPDPAHLWIPGHPAASMALVGFDGSPTGTLIDIPDGLDAGSLSPDGAGYLMFGSTSGEYDLKPSGIQRITTGTVFASGPTGWLADECDAQYRCSATVISRSNGARHSINVPVSNLLNGGVISPDGNTAAVLEGDGGPARLHLIDLHSGADRSTDVTLNPDLDYQDGLFVWSPDSHWLFATNATGRLYAIDSAANKTNELPLTLGPVSQLALRS